MVAEKRSLESCSARIVMNLGVFGFEGHDYIQCREVASVAPMVYVIMSPYVLNSREQELHEDRFVLVHC